MINIEDIDSNLLKIDKNRTKTLIFITMDTSQQKSISDYESINSVLAMVVRSVFEEDGKYYPQIFLDESLYEL